MTTPTPKTILERLQSAAPNDLNERLSHVVSWSRSASQQELRVLLQGIAERIDAQQDRSSLFALVLQYVTLPDEGVCSLLEHMLEVVLSSTPEALEFLDALPQLALPEEVDQDALQPDELDELLALERQKLIQRHPSSAAAAHRIKDALSASLGVLERDRPALRQARACAKWQDALSAVSHGIQEAQMMRVLCQCLDDQPMLCVSLDEGIVWTLKADGITDLKQLHALLVHALVKPLDEDALGIVDGSGPHFNGSWIEGQWSFVSGPSAEVPLSEEEPLTCLPRITWHGTQHVVVCVRAAHTYTSWTLMRTFDVPASVDVLERSDVPAQIEAILALL